MTEQPDDSGQADDEQLAHAEPVDGADPADRRRTELIAAAQARWVAALTDLGGRNTLLYYKDRRAGTLDLAAADPAALDRFLRTGSARLTRLFHDVDARADAIRRVQVIHRKARELLEERGIRAGYLATGIARWDELFLEPAAPVLLRGLTITPTRARHDDFELVLDDDYEVNPVLLYKLASVFGAATEELAEQPASRVGPLLCRAAEAAEVPGFAIIDRQVIGTFTYAKLPMVRDLQAAGELLNDSDVVAAVAGDPEAQESLGAADPAVGEASGPLLDSPEEDYSVLDADSSQRGAIGAVLAGRSLVIHGPPGTGKSQTIANLIATLVARGRKVLFVAEKRAAIDAVLSRLKGVGLGGMVLDIHEGTRDRLRIARDLGETLDEAQRTQAPDLTDLHRRLVDRQQRLSQHATALHEVHKPWGLTPFEVQAALLGGRPRRAPRSGWPARSRSPGRRPTGSATSCASSPTWVGLPCARAARRGTAPRCAPRIRPARRATSWPSSARMSCPRCCTGWPARRARPGCGRRAATRTRWPCCGCTRRWRRRSATSIRRCTRPARTGSRPRWVTGPG